MPLHHRPHPTSLKRQQGVVIVVALFIVALVATMAYLMMSRLERDTRRANLLTHSVQAELYAQGSVLWASEQLRSNWEQKKPKQLVDILPIQSPPETVNGYTITSNLYDLQARYNLNNISIPETQEEFKRLMLAVAPDLSVTTAQEIAAAISDWISPMNTQNEFSKYYLAQSPPYRAAHRPMVSISELLLVKGMTPRLFSALRPYITVLPQTTLINVQTAAAPLFTTLNPDLSLATAQSIVEVRKQNPFVSPEIFLQSDIIKNHPVSAQKFVVLSHYFLLETEVVIEKQRLVLYTILERSVSENKATVTIIGQSKGIM